MNEERADRDVPDEVDSAMSQAEDADDQTRLDTLEKVQKDLEAELDEGAEAPPAGR